VTGTFTARNTWTADEPNPGQSSFLTSKAHIRSRFSAQAKVSVRSVIVLLVRTLPDLIRSYRRGGQFVVSMAGVAYHAQVERLNRKSPSGGVH